MVHSNPRLLALDFDGVLLDGLVEYFQTAWRTYCQVWQPDHPSPTDGLADQFYRLRPVVESGWEMPVLIRALSTGISETQLWHNWSVINHTLLAETGLSAVTLGDWVDRVRDQWIASDPTGWLGLHRFYPGVCDRLKPLLLNHPTKTVVCIVTTKEKRFVQQLLQQTGIEFPDNGIYGRELGRPKTEILRELMGIYGEPVWFVEDRLKTLQGVQKQPDLASICLFLANWGYNTPTEREIATADPDLHVLNLITFGDCFENWIETT